jgi:type I restriction enzyme M protein
MRAVFVPRDATYVDFSPEIERRADLKALVENDPGVQAQEAAIAEAFRRWWDDHQDELIALPHNGNLYSLRADLLSSFGEALSPVGLLDRYKVAGVVASWWQANELDLRVLHARDFSGLVDSWIATFRALVEPDGDGRQKPLKIDLGEHRLISRLLPDYLAALAGLEERQAEIEGQLDAAQQPDDDEAGEDADEPELSAEELKALRKDLREVKQQIKELKASLLQALGDARAALTVDDCREVALDIFYEDLETILTAYVADHRAQVVAAIENWWDKYRVTLTSVEEERDAAAGKLREYLGALGYA